MASNQERTATLDLSRRNVPTMMVHKQVIPKVHCSFIFCEYVLSGNLTMVQYQAFCLCPSVSLFIFPLCTNQALPRCPINLKSASPDGQSNGSLHIPSHFKRSRLRQPTGIQRAGLGEQGTTIGTTTDPHSNATTAIAGRGRTAVTAVQPLQMGLIQ